jgi:hypothetical protein
MPSQIANGGNIVDIAANYLVAKPSTQFGTRQLTVLNIAQTGVETDYEDSNSLFSKTIRAVQQTAEVWAVFTPTTDAVKVIIATDTQFTGDSAHQGAVNGGGVSGAGGYGVFETAIQAGSGVAATVTVPAGFVAAYNG